MTEISEAAEHMLGLLEQALRGTQDLLEGVEPGEWSAPTPCEEMTVHQLAEHLVGGLTQFAGVGAGQPVDAVSFEVSFPADEAATRYDHAGEEMVSVWSRPGVADRPHAMPWGETPGVMLLGFMFMEQIGHGWDLAVATKQEPGYDDDLVEAALALARDYDDPSIRVPGMFGPVVAIADDAPAIDRLAAFQGRNPAVW